MKITRRQLRKLIQEVTELSGINLPNMNAEGFFDLVPAGYVSRRPTAERIAYGINGVTGSSGGRNMGYIAIASFHAAQTENWGKPGNPAPMPVEHYAENAGRIWSRRLKEDHGVNVTPQQITNGLLNGTIRIQMNEPPRDVYMSYNESLTRSDINRLISREIRLIFETDDPGYEEESSTQEAPKSFEDESVRKALKKAMIGIVGTKKVMNDFPYEKLRDAFKKAGIKELEHQTSDTTLNVGDVIEYIEDEILGASRLDVPITFKDVVEAIEGLGG